MNGINIGARRQCSPSRIAMPEKCQDECQRVYRDAHKGEIPWADARHGAALLSKLSTMIAANGDDTGEDWSDVGKNALRR